ncbi:leucine-rich repeat receptor-like protein kinase family protein [Striga asiatica]|uniref:Leucine-rich repeat receptor-like protein kinase family protein n=1 Tax=Striga asiatica TaxID=4170 RepID=A0A5A7QEF4_STRAF|nr:leucine-rich repeat receptor-like protein kinase family protein [Striga asiatica]
MENRVEKLSLFNASTTLFTIAPWHVSPRTRSPPSRASISSPFLPNCSKLQYRDLSQNYSVGEIPKNIDQLQSLPHFDMSAYNFIVDIPPEVWNLTDMRTLNLYINLYLIIQLIFCFNL